MFVLPEKFFVGMLWVEVPLNDFDSLQSSSLLLVDTRATRLVSICRLGSDSTELTGWGVRLAILRKMAQHQVLLRLCQVQLVLRI